MADIASKTVYVGAPPPPSEVKIRTMRSDIESMARSGGGQPRFQNVAISGLSLEKEYKGSTIGSMTNAAPVARPSAPLAPAFTPPASMPSATAPQAVARGPANPSPATSTRSPAAQTPRGPAIDYGAAMGSPVSAPMSTPVPAAYQNPPAQDPQNERKSELVPILIVIIVALLAIGGVGYFAYITFWKS